MSGEGVRFVSWVKFVSVASEACVTGADTGVRSRSESWAISVSSGIEAWVSFEEDGSGSWVNFVGTASGAGLRSECIVLEGWVTSVDAEPKAWVRLEGVAFGD